MIKKSTKIMIGIVLFVTIVMILILIFSKNTYYTQNLDNIYSNFNFNNLLGTDNLGRDNLVRYSQGFLISLFISILINIFSSIIGIFYGLVLAFSNKFFDNIFMRIIEIFLTVPSMIYTILILIYLGDGVFNIVLALSITRWTSYALITRIEVKKLLNMDYIKTSINMGASKIHLFKTHIFKNIVNILTVKFMINLVHNIFSEIFLSFLGLSVSKPSSSLGILISEGFKNISNYPSMFLIPVILLLLLSVTFNKISNDLGDVC